MIPLNRICFIVAVCIATQCTWRAQPPLQLKLESIVNKFGDDPNGAKDALSDFLDNETVEELQRRVAQINIGTLVDAQQEKLAREFDLTSSTIARHGSQRMSRQLGNPALSTGSTSLVSRTGTTSFLSAAVESGAVSSKTDQGVASFTVNALPIAQLLNREPAPYGCGTLERASNRNGQPLGGACASGYGRWLRGLSGSVAFNVNSKETPIPLLSQVPGGTLASNGVAVLRSGGNISALAVKYELFVKETKKDKLDTYLANSATALNKNLEASGLLTAIAKASEAVWNDPAYPPWKKSTTEALVAILEKSQPADRKLTEVMLVLERQIDLLQGLLTSPILRQQLGSTEKLVREYQNTVAGLVANGTYRKALSVDFVHQRPTNQPFINKIRLDLNTPLKRKPVSLQKYDNPESNKAKSGDSVGSAAAAGPNSVTPEDQASALAGC